MKPRIAPVTPGQEIPPHPCPDAVDSLAVNGMTIPQCWEAIGQWSQYNFGDQKGLHHFAPTLGLVEETGELIEAIENDDTADVINDAVGDFCVYACDFMFRLNIHPREVWPVEYPEDRMHSLPVYLGRLCHVILKRHQGIRGYDNDEFFNKMVRAALAQCLAVLAKTYDINYLLIHTWQTAVAKRDWKKNKEAAHLNQ